MEFDTVTHTETDLSLRLVEVWYDITWAYYMSSHGDNVAKRIDKRRKTLSSTASVASTIVDGAMVGRSMKEKMHVLECNLKEIKSRMKARQFEDICKVSMKSNDDLYPGFKDILLIAKYLIQRGEAYQNSLTLDEINGLTLTSVFQYVYYQLCDFLLASRTGREAMKLVIAPSKITHATYDICRQKFCRLLCDETSIVQYGLFQLIKRVRQERDGEEVQAMALVDDNEALVDTNPHDPTPVPSGQQQQDPDVVVASPVSTTTDVVNDVVHENVNVEENDVVHDVVHENENVHENVNVEENDVVNEVVHENTAATVASFSSNARQPSYAAIPYTNTKTSRNTTENIKFPVIDFSSDDSDLDSDAESVSSLGSRSHEKI